MVVKKKGGVVLRRKVFSVPSLVLKRLLLRFLRSAFVFVDDYCYSFNLVEYSDGDWVQGVVSSKGDKKFVFEYHSNEDRFFCYVECKGGRKVLLCSVILGEEPLTLLEESFSYEVISGMVDDFVKKNKDPRKPVGGKSE